MKHVGVIAACPFLVDRGTPLRIRGLCNGLNQLGHRVTVVSYHLGRDLSNSNITVKRIPDLPLYNKTQAGPSWKKPLVDLILLGRAYQVFKGDRVDCLLGSHIEGGFIAAVLKRLLHVPALFDAHGSFAKEMQAFGYSAGFDGLYRTIENFVLTAVDGIGAVSQRLRDDFQQRCSHTPVRYVSNGVNLDNYRSTRNVRPELDLPAETTLVTYAGNLQEYQGIDYLLDTARGLGDHNAHFLVVGGPDEDRYRSRAREEGLEDSFTFVGRVEASEVPAYLTSSDILVAPRIGRDTESQQASKLIQYLAAGKAILATDIPPHDVIEDGRTGLLVGDQSSQALASGLERLLTNETLRNRLGKNARETAEEYSWESVTSKLMKTLTD